MLNKCLVLIAYFIALLLQVTHSTEFDNLLPGTEDLYDIQDLKSRLETIMKLVSTSFPQLTRNYESQIQGITNDIKIPSILSTLREDTTALLKSDGVPTIACSTLAVNEIDSLTNSAKASVTTCSQEAEDEIEKLTSQIDNILNTAKELLSDTTLTAEQCVASNLVNRFDLVKCLAGVVLNADKTLLQLEGDVTNTLGSAQQVAGDTALGFGACLVRTETQAVKLSRDIMQDVQHCIHNKNM